MPAVNNVLVVGGGLAGAATAIHLAKAGVAVDLDRDQARRRRARLRHHPAGQRAARARGARRLGPGAGARATPSTHRHPRARPGTARVLAEIPDAKTGGPDLPAAMGMPRPELARILVDRATEVGVKVRFGTTFTELDPGRRRRRRHLLRRLDRPLRPRRRRRRRPLVDPPRARHRPGDQVGRHGHLARLRARGRPASPAPTCTTAARRYIAGYCPTGEDSLYAYIVEDAQDRSDPVPGGAAGDDAASSSQAYHGPWDEIRETLTDPARVNYTWFETHVLAGAVEPRPGRAHRRRRAHLPAHPRPGRRHGAGGRRRPRRAADRARQRSTRTLWDAFTARRYERAKTVVDASNQLAPVAARPRPGRRPGPHALASPCSPASPPEPDHRRSHAMTQRLITHLRHVDLAVPDYDKQLDFYTDTGA